MEKDVLSSLLRINRYYRRSLKAALAPYGYLGVMHLILLYVSRHPGASQEEITCFYALDKGSVARDARRLEDLGHIERHILPENRRQYQMFITEAGQAMMERIDSAMERFVKLLSSGISAEDWRRSAELLKRLEANVCISSDTQLSSQLLF